MARVGSARLSRIALPLLAACAALIACGPGPSAQSVTPNKLGNVAAGPTAIPFVAIARDGDPKSAIALAVATEDIGNESAVRVAAALGGIVEARLKKSGDVTFALAIDGYRIRALVASSDEATAFATAVRAALVTPIGEEDVAAARDKLHALATRPLISAELLPIAQCTGDPRVVAASEKDPDVALLETWRARSHVLARVSLATSGPSRVTDAVAHALTQMPKLDAGEPVANTALGIPPFAAEAIEGADTKITITRFFPAASRALGAAQRLSESPLAGRLVALDLGVRAPRIGATAHPNGGCVDVTITLADSGKATLDALVMATMIANDELDGSFLDSETNLEGVARRQADPQRSAEAAAWLALSRSTEKTSANSIMRVEIGSSRSTKIAPADLENALARARAGRDKPVVETRMRIERGQGEIYVLLASPCGTFAESNSDAGLSAAAITAITPDSSAQVSIEGIALADAVGLVAHGPALIGESRLAHARRIADAIAKPIFGEMLTDDRARRTLHAAFSLAGDDAARALSALAAEAAPGHLSWLVPEGAQEPLGRAEERTLAAKIAALRAGPLRVAILANDDVEQANTLSHAIDRWVTGRDGAARSCEPLAPPELPHAGTYAVNRTSPGASEAFIAAPIPDPKSYAGAQALAALLDGGMLEKALSNGLARSSSVRVLGAPRSAVLTVRVTTADGALDAAVAQTRALLARLAHGALTDEEAKRAFDLRAKNDADVALDPRQRLLAIFRDAPEPMAETPEGLRTLAQAMFKEDGLVIVALRPPKPKVH